jgi:hypothetical protein
MNRNFLLIPLMILIFLGIELLGNHKPDADIASSPRAVQYREKITELIAIGGGNISDACRASLKHTVLVTCEASSINIVAIHNFLSKDGWQKINNNENDAVKYQNSKDVLTIQRGGGSYLVSLKAEK